MKAIYILITSLLIFTPKSPEMEERRYKDLLYYFPLFSHAEPLDEFSIENQYDLTSICQRVVPKLISVITANPQASKQIDLKQIRLKIVYNKETYLLDLVGNVKCEGKIWRISRDQKLKIREIIFDTFPDH